ncbi:cell division protein FtsZ [Patescibacteria group bacterium]|nr:cell division protein FtsZ [Patescibacteria group bacterium]
MAEIKPDIETSAKIKVIGVGGGGGAAVNRMMKEKVRGVDFIAVNTDAQALYHNAAPVKIAIGKAVTRGLGAGMNPEIGKRAAEENGNDLRNALAGADMVFLTAGLGGGTGSGAIPELAKIAKDIGALTVAVVTKPFAFEGAQRRRIAEDAHTDLGQHVDAIITISNDRVLQIVDKKASVGDSFRLIDDVLRQGVLGIAEVITTHGDINVDFADVKAIMQNAGSAIMGIGRASGENRAVEAAKMAISNGLLEMSMDGAKGVLFTVSGNDVGMYELTEAAKIITGSADDDAKVIFGLIKDESIGDEIRITVVATGFDSRNPARSMARPDSVTITPKQPWKSEGSEFSAPRRPTHTPPPSASAAPSGESPFAKRSFSALDQDEPIVSPSRERDREREEREVSSTPVAPPPKPVVQNQNDKDKDDDGGDFGIPAFIRRRMM